ncbi:MAG: S-layer protein, partial [Planctomycetales bacterium]|nr:S-layer protein [Planctomycetales bacterium]
MAAAPLNFDKPGSVVELELIADPAAHASKQPVKLTGRSQRLQLIATARYDSGVLRDVTQQANYQANPGGVVQVDSSGFVVPVGDGSVTVVASASGRQASVQITVERINDPPAVNFANEVSPILTKLGCNGGGCHGKSGGQNGFALSLLGFEPQEDYTHIVKEGRGRRLSPAAPAHSLLLRKATGQSPHGGGMRLAPDGDDYRMLLLWIEQGMPQGQADDPTLVGVSVYPTTR